MVSCDAHLLAFSSWVAELVGDLHNEVKRKDQKSIKG